jgi:hypothetical protein
MTNQRILLSKQPHTAGNFGQQGAEKNSKKLRGGICVREKDKVVSHTEWLPHPGTDCRIYSLSRRFIPYISQIEAAADAHFSKL